MIVPLFRVTKVDGHKRFDLALKLQDRQISSFGLVFGSRAPWDIINGLEPLGLKTLFSMKKLGMLCSCSFVQRSNTTLSPLFSISRLRSTNRPMLTQVRFISFWLPHSLITEELLRLAKDIYDQFVMRELLIRQRRKEKDLRKGDFVPFLKFPTKSAPLY